MKTISFERDDDEKLIILECKVNFHKVFLALDTGASHTTIDLTALQIAGYSLADAEKEVDIETASGVIKGYIFNIKKLYALDIVAENVQICAYDFFAHHVLSDFDGVLGIDFFANKKLCIDFNQNIITVQENYLDKSQA
jgi:hypothetical protein